MNPEKSVLVVEDNDDDFAIVESVFGPDAAPQLTLHRLETGESALDYLMGRNSFAGAARPRTPDLVLLDLNLPGTDGHAVLRTIKENDATRAVPVVVMTTSHNQSHIAQCYHEGANSFVVKPIAPRSYCDMLNRARDYWFSIVETAPRNRLTPGLAPGLSAGWAACVRPFRAPVVTVADPAPPLATAPRGDHADCAAPAHTHAPSCSAPDTPLHIPLHW